MPKIGLLADEFSNFADLVAERLGIAGSVGEKDAVGLERQDILRGSVPAGTTVMRAPTCTQAAQDVALQSVIVGDNVAALFGGRGEDL